MTWTLDCILLQHTDGVVEVVPFSHQPTPEQLIALGFNEAQCDAKFTVLCENITSDHPEIIAIRREIPHSDTIYHVKKKTKRGILFSDQEDVLHSDLYKKTAHFIGLIGNHLYLDLDSGGYYIDKYANKSELLSTVGKWYSIYRQTYVMRSREISLKWVKSNMWHFQFSIWLKCSFGEVHFAENTTWIGPVVPSYEQLRDSQNNRK